MQPLSSPGGAAENIERHAGMTMTQLVVERGIRCFLWEEDTSARKEPLAASWEPSIIHRD